MIFSRQISECSVLVRESTCTTAAKGRLSVVIDYNNSIYDRNKNSTIKHYTTRRRDSLNAARPIKIVHAVDGQCPAAISSSPGRPKCAVCKTTRHSITFGGEPKQQKRTVTGCKRLKKDVKKRVFIVASRSRQVHASPAPTRRSDGDCPWQVFTEKKIIITISPLQPGSATF